MTPYLVANGPNGSIKKALQLFAGLAPLSFN
jgi:hypothetical protein